MTDISSEAKVAAIANRFALKDLTHTLITDLRKSEGDLLRAAIFDAYQRGFDAGLNAQKEIADGFPQA